MDDRSNVLGHGRLELEGRRPILEIGQLRLLLLFSLVLGASPNFLLLDFDTLLLSSDELSKFVLELAVVLRRWYDWSSRGRAAVDDDGWSGYLCWRRNLDRDARRTTGLVVYFWSQLGSGGEGWSRSRLGRDVLRSSCFGSPSSSGRNVGSSTSYDRSIPSESEGI